MDERSYLRSSGREEKNMTFARTKPTIGATREATTSSFDDAIIFRRLRRRQERNDVDEMFSLVLFILLIIWIRYSFIARSLSRALS